MGFFWIFIFILGIVFGSFANAWIWRLRVGLPIWSGRSICPNCKKKIEWRDNIPLISFLLLKGRCRKCKNMISWQYQIVELATGLVFLAVYYFSSQNYWALAANLFISFFLVCTFVYDLKYYEIPDCFSLWPVPILLVFNAAVLKIPWQNILVNIGIGAGFFLLQYWISKGRWIGAGDIRLGLLIALSFSRPALVIAALFFAYIAGSCVGIALVLIRKKEMKSEVPFGTFLAASTFAMMLFGSRVVSWYFHLISGSR